MSILDTFLILFETDAKKARAEMADLRKEGDNVAHSIDTSVKSSSGLLDITQQIAASVAKVVQQEKNLQQYMLGNEDITEDTIKGLGGLEKLHKRIAQEVERQAKAQLRVKEEVVETEVAAKKTHAVFAKIGQLVGAVSAALVVRSLAGALNQTVEEADRLVEASGRLRLSAQDFDTWTRAVWRSGGEIKDAEASLASYDDMLRKIQAGIGKRGVEALAALGLTATTADGSLKDVRTSLLEVAGALEGMDRAEALRAIRRLGISDTGTVEMLLKGRKAIEELTEAQLKNGAITNEQAARIDEYKDKTEQLEGVLQGWKFAIVSAVIPALTTLNDWLMRGAKWIGENTDLVKGFGIAMAVAGGIIMATFVPAIWAAAAGVIATTWPVLAIIAAVVALGAAFALAYEDVKAFFNGQPSLIGSLIDAYPKLGAAIVLIARGFQATAAIAGEVFRNIAAGIGWIAGLFDNLGAKVSGFGAALRGIPGLNGIGSMMQGVRAGQQQLGAASQSPWAAATSGSVGAAGNRTTNQSVGNVTVNTRATDGPGTGQAVRQSLTQIWTQSHGELNDGVAR